MVGNVGGDVFGWLRKIEEEESEHGTWHRKGMMEGRETVGGEKELPAKGTVPQ